MQCCVLMWKRSFKVYFIGIKYDWCTEYAIRRRRCTEPRPPVSRAVP